MKQIRFGKQKPVQHKCSLSLSVTPEAFAGKATSFNLEPRLSIWDHATCVNLPVRLGIWDDATCVNYKSFSLEQRSEMMLHI